jgi:hypothetical protein
MYSCEIYVVIFYCFSITPLLNILQNFGKLTLTSFTKRDSWVYFTASKCFDKLRTCLPLLFLIRPAKRFLYLIKRFFRPSVALIHLHIFWAAFHNDPTTVRRVKHLT